MEPTVFIGFILAIALGALIGTERELPWAGTKLGWATGFGGIRTFATISFFGAICAWFDKILGVNIWIAIGAIISGLFVLASYIYASFQRDKMGATSEYAAIIAYFIGVIAMLWHYTTAVILSIFLLLLLSAKEYFAKLKSRFSRKELGDTLKFAVIALVILPLLPDQKYSLIDMMNWFYSGHLSWTHPILSVHFFNPYGIWFFVVVMAGVEYAGFILSKTIGAKSGIIAAGAIGGLISSTATTIAMTKKSNEHPEHRNSYVVATLIASCIMFLRVLIVAAVIYPRILETITRPALFMLLGLTGMTLYYFFESRNERIPVQDDEKKESYESPFQLVPALQFAWLIVVVKFISNLGAIYKDIVPLEVSNYFLGIISGFADVDAINLTSSEWARDGILPLLVASTTILLAVISNNCFKAWVAYHSWESIFWKKVLHGFSVSIILGLCVIVIMNLLK